jgi:hypothetical protein
MSEIVNYVPGVPEMTKGETLDLTVRQLIKHMALHFLEVGGLLAEIWEQKLWGVGGYDRWQDYTESLGIGSYQYIMSLIGISKMVAAQVVSAADLEEIGYSKACLLVSLHNSGKLTRDLLDLARDCTNRDLRMAIGYKVPHNDSDCSITCQNCGNVITGAAWVKNEKVRE